MSRSHPPDRCVGEWVREVGQREQAQDPGLGCPPGLPVLQLLAPHAADQCHQAQGRQAYRNGATGAATASSVCTKKLPVSTIGGPPARPLNTQLASLPLAADPRHRQEQRCKCWGTCLSILFLLIHPQRNSKKLSDDDVIINVCWLRGCSYTAVPERMPAPPPISMWLAGLQRKQFQLLPPHTW